MTRTRNQLEIYCRELKEVKKHSSLTSTASVFKSKMEMCPHIMDNTEMRGVSYRDFLYYCKGLRSGIFGHTCIYYDGVYSGWKPSQRSSGVVDEIKKVGPLMPDEVYGICCDLKLCPYEVTKILARYADVIVGNYNYILVDPVRRSILGRAGLNLRDLNCIFDEAHNLPYYATSILSDELSSTSLRRAIGEVETFRLKDSDLLDTLYDLTVKLGRNVYEEFGFDFEHVIGRDELINYLLRELRVDADRLLEMISELSRNAELVRHRRVEAGKTPTSYLSRCATFLLDWVRLKDPSYARYVRVEVDGERKNIKLGIKCLDPALTANIINNLRSTILMSGTLWHTNYYIDVLGIRRDRCVSLELPNPFPLENRLIIIDRSVTTKFERRNERQWRRIATHLTQIIQRINGRVAVYYPSYEVMREISKYAELNVPVIFEGKNTKISDILQFLKTHKRCVVQGVSGGKVSEGVDMSIEGRSMLSAVIIIGLPYPKKTELHEALYRYFKARFGEKALEYVNEIPCLNSLAQSAGRLLRSPEDRGIILIMDGRAAGRFRHKLPKEWREEMEPHLKIERIIDGIENFYIELSGKPIHP
ncbi:MAG: ATP-dependent DNA helicase [Candidatus Bathyarchaeia archaeon]